MKPIFMNDENRQFFNIIPSMLFLIDKNRIIVDVNQIGASTLGYTRDELIGNVSDMLVFDEDKAQVKNRINEVLNSTEVNNSTNLVFRKKKKDESTCWVQERIVQIKAEDGETLFLLSCEDITRQKIDEILLQKTNHIHELIIKGSELSLILTEIITTVESINRKVKGSILLLNSDNTLYHGAGPSLNKEYIDYIDGVEIGLNVGSCGTAAYTKQRIIVEDIEDSILWKPYSHKAIQYKLRACWSEPIIASTGEVFGTFALYQSIPAAPTELDIKLIETFTSLASLAIEYNKTKENLIVSEHHFKPLFQNNLDAVFTLDLNGIMVDCNRSMEKLTGYDKDEIQKMHFTQFIDLKDINYTRDAFQRSLQGTPVQIECLIVRKDRTQRFINVTTVPVTIRGNLTSVFGIAKDVTEQKKNEDTIIKMAYHDSLTGLPNRRLLLERLEDTITQSNETKLPFYVIYIDLDRFKNVNDSLGHKYGDMLLNVIANRILQLVEPNDTVSRVGGDEFIIVLRSESCIDNVLAKCEQLLSELKRPIKIAQHDLRITPSIGVTSYPCETDCTCSIDVERILNRADLAMYKAKAEGGNKYLLYKEEMAVERQRHIHLDNYLRFALEKEELSLAYQPILEVKSRKIVGAEALLRWYCPKLGHVSPVQFIPIAEESGFIVELGEWVIQQVCKQHAYWRDEMQVCLRIAVNISMHQLQEKDFWMNVERILREHHIEPSYLEVEVTESTIMQDERNVLCNIKELKNLGVKISIDDFGTGYSSLTYLKQFSIDSLKIDKSFITDLPEHNFNKAITDTICSLAQTLNIRLIAEGVEEEAQYNYLKQIGVHEAQGYLFSRPLPVSDFTKLL
ncbi:EAL domain-containing protein [Bacillus alkalisoli]|uniref:EAL domain-containing protein n=1 Tax=Bacillus alkalisoli TaxID=2011008 RepID=UPI000C24ECE6|nr:EAL domain-containing protein [Bacillus alkalisoli]